MGKQQELLHHLDHLDFHNPQCAFQLTEFVTSNLSSLLSEQKELKDSIVPVILAIPDKLCNFYQFEVVPSSKFFLEVVSGLLQLDSSLFTQAKTIVDKILVRGKVHAFVSALKTAEANHFTQSLLIQVTPVSTLLFCMFRELSVHKFTEYLPELFETQKIYLTSQLPFKNHPLDLAAKYTAIIKHYSLQNLACSQITKQWSHPGFLKYSFCDKCKCQLVICEVLKDLVEFSTDQETKERVMNGIRERLESGETQQRGMDLAQQLLGEAHEETPQETTQETSETFTPYLEELVRSLQSSEKSRFLNAWNCLNKVLLEDLEELDLLFSELSDLVFKLPNAFQVDHFEEHRLESLSTLGYLRPKLMLETLQNRLQEGSVGTQLLAIEVTREVARKLANPPTVQVPRSAVKQRLHAKTRYFSSFKPKNTMEVPNKFYPVFEDYSALIIKNTLPESHFMVKAKAIYVLSELVNYAGASRSVQIVRQCVYMLRYLVKPNLVSGKKEVVEACLILLSKICDKLEDTEDYPGICNDLEETMQSVHTLPQDYQEFANKCLFKLLSLQSLVN